MPKCCFPELASRSDSRRSSSAMSSRMASRIQCLIWKGCGAVGAAPDLSLAFEDLVRRANLPSAAGMTIRNWPDWSQRP
jgi:hypothetical protein